MESIFYEYSHSQVFPPTASIDWLIFPANSDSRHCHRRSSWIKSTTSSYAGLATPPTTETTDGHVAEHLHLYINEMRNFRKLHTEQNYDIVTINWCWTRRHSAHRYFLCVTTPAVGILLTSPLGSESHPISASVQKDKCYVITRVVKTCKIYSVLRRLLSKVGITVL